MLALRHLVVGMYLYAEVALGIDELYQQGQLAMVLLVDSLTQDVFRVFADDRDNISASKGAIADNAGAGGDCAHLPALANGFIGGLQTFIDLKSMTTPNYGVQIGMKQKGI